MVGTSIYYAPPQAPAERYTIEPHQDVSNASNDALLDDVEATDRAVRSRERPPLSEDEFRSRYGLQ